MGPAAMGSDTVTAGLVSIVVPVRQEAASIPALFAALRGALHVPCEILIVFDADDDPTIPVVHRTAASLPFSVRLIKNTLGPGPANALRSGFAGARGEAVVVLMADLSDDVALIDQMVDHFGRGGDVVCPSRYSPGGEQIGGPWLKRTLSRLAGISLHRLVSLPTHDATNSFKLYRRRLLRSLTLESTRGFEISLEITVKAWRGGWKIVELPSRWIDRTAGKSKFKLWSWLPRYLRWYLYALGHGLGKRPAVAPSDSAHTVTGS